MDISLLNNCLVVSKKLYDFINSVKNIKHKYNELCNDLIIVISLFYEIKGSRRLIISNSNIQETIKMIEEKLFYLYRKLRKREKMNYKERILHTLKRDIDEKKESLNLLIKRLKLLLDINRQKLQKSRLDIVNILKDDKLIVFWEKNIGSEKNMINYDLLIQCLEDEFGTKLRKQEKIILCNIIDIDENEIISVYEFNIWIKRFGPLNNAIKNTLISLYDTKRDDLYEWYFGDMFMEKVINFLKDKGYGTTIIRNNFIQITNDIILFYLVFVGWSFSMDNIELFEIPIIRSRNKYYLDIDKITNLGNNGKEFIKHFLYDIDKDVLYYDDLVSLYLNFQVILRKSANIFKLIYYSHFENSSYYNMVLGELINFYNKCSSKTKRIFGFEDEKGSWYNFCQDRR